MKSCFYRLLILSVFVKFLMTINPAYAVNFTNSIESNSFKDDVSFDSENIDISSISDLIKAVSVGDIERLFSIVSEVYSLDIPLEVGELGIPDPGRAQDSLNEEFDSFDVDESSIIDDSLGSKLGDSGSFALREDYQRKWLAELVGGVAEETGLSKEAQEVSSESIEESQKAKETSVELAQQSDRTDTSQEILRNISNQLSQSHTTDDLLYRAIEQSQLTESADAAISAQIAEGIQEQQTFEQREKDNVNGKTLNGWGFVLIPGTRIED